MTVTPRQSRMNAIEALGQSYGFSLSDMIGRCRVPGLVYARHAAMANIRQDFGLSYPEIGRLFGGRDHTTVFDGIQRHHARMAWVEILTTLGGGGYQPDLFAKAA